MECNVRERDGVIIIELSGRIIGSASGTLRKAIDGQLANASEGVKLLFDFAHVSAMDSSGLGTMMATHLSIARQGGRIGIINVGANIKNLIIRSRLITTLEHFDSEDEVITAFTAAAD